MFKKIYIFGVLFVLSFALTGVVSAKAKVKSIPAKNPAYVQPQAKVSPTKSKPNNSTKKNTKPHTGKKGTKNPSKR